MDKCTIGESDSTFEEIESKNVKDIYSINEVNTSILSFNKSICNREDFITNKEPYQILPGRGYISENLIKSFENLNIDFDNKILIHTTFITRPFSSKSFLNEDNLNSCKYNLKQYIKLCNVLRTKYILIHGPMNEDEYNNFNKGLDLINEVYKNTNLIICIEITAFSSSLIKLIKNNNYYEFCKEYLNKVINYKSNNFNFQIVIDTAHLHTNGLNYKEMINLLEYFKDNYDFIHLNGNIKEQFKYPDNHVHINSIDDKIIHSRRLLIFVSKLNKICICENTDEDENNDNYEYWVHISKKYGFKMVEYNNNYSY